MKNKNIRCLINLISTLILSIYILPIYSQNVIEGSVIDSLSREALPYVNIGVVDQNVGTVSNINGLFKIDLPKKYDTLRLKVSIIGYKSRVFQVIDFKKMIKETQVVKLLESPFNLDEVVVRSNKLKTEILGNKSTSKIIEAGFKNNELGNEVGIKIKVKNTPTYLERFNFYITDCKYDSLLFRLNVYSIKDNIPWKNILFENIYFSTVIKKGNVTVDLEPYNIVLDEDFILTIEWIQDLGEGGLIFSAGMFNKPMYHRQTSFGKWKKTSLISLGFNVEVSY